MKVLKQDLTYMKPQQLLPTPRAEQFIGKLEAQPEQQESVVIGGTASGKLTMTREFAARSGRPTAEFHGSFAADPTDVDGCFVPHEGGFAFQESKMKTTAEAGGIVIIDSPSMMSADTQNQVADLVTKNPQAKFIAVMHDQEVDNGQLTGKFVNAFLQGDPAQKIEV